MKTTILTALCLSLAAVAAAQTAAPPPVRPRFELTLSAEWGTSASYGSRAATLTTADGRPFTLFTATSSQGMGAGAEVIISTPLFRRLRGEVSGGWLRTSLRTKIADDFDGAFPATLSGPLSQFSVQGSALLSFRRRAHSELFVRGGAGWVRQLTSDNVLANDASIITAGGGMKYWWRDQRRGWRPMGLRVDVRVVARSGGLGLGSRSTSIGAAVTGGLIFGLSK